MIYVHTFELANAFVLCKANIYILIHVLFFFRVSSSQTQQLNRCVQDCEGPSPCGGPKPEYEDAYIDVYACCASQPWVEECAATPGPTPPPKPTKPPSSSPTPRPSTMKPTGKPTEPQPTKVSPILVNNAALCHSVFLLFFHFLHLILFHSYYTRHQLMYQQWIVRCTNGTCQQCPAIRVIHARMTKSIPRNGLIMHSSFYMIPLMDVVR